MPIVVICDRGGTLKEKLKTLHRGKAAAYTEVGQVMALEL